MNVFGFLVSNLADLSLDKIWSSLIVVFIFLFGIWEIGKKLIELFTSYHKKQNDKEDTQELLQECVDNYRRANDNIDKLLKAYVGLTDVMKRMMKHSIVRVCDDSLKKGKIGAYELESLEELYEAYSSKLIHGNSYVGGLMKKVRQLEIDYTTGDPASYKKNNNRNN